MRQYEQGTGDNQRCNGRGAIAEITGAAADRELLVLIVSSGLTVLLLQNILHLRSIIT